MTGQTTAVLKKSAVRVAGPCHIDPAAARASDAPQVRIVETTAAGALLEVRCACGRCTYVQCRWPAKGAQV
jgi:hypothetical protein